MSNRVILTQIGVLFNAGIAVKRASVVQWVQYGKTDTERGGLHSPAQYERLAGAHAAYAGKKVWRPRTFGGVWAPWVAGALVGIGAKF